MNDSLFDPETIGSFPEEVGVYVMKDHEGVVLYVGKAKNLKSRLRQYYAPSSSDERIQIPALLSKVVSIETILTESEKEALLLEARLIRRYKPRYNVLLKDDRSELCVFIQKKHSFPRIGWIREKEVVDASLSVFGPFDSSLFAKQIFDIVIRVCQLRQCSDGEFSRRKSPCLLYQLHRCFAPCVGHISEKKYAETVALATTLLSGKTAALKKILQLEIEKASKKLEFEKASQLYQMCSVIRATPTKCQKKISKSNDAMDVIGVCTHADVASICIMHYVQNTLQYAETKTFSYIVFQDFFEQFFAQYYLESHDLQQIPQKIILPFECASIDIFLEAFTEKGKKVHVFHPNTERLFQMADLAKKNAQAALFQSIRISGKNPDLKQLLLLKKQPRTIDCFDGSHFSGKGLVAACVRYADGKKDKKMYRTFHIRTTSTGDDVKMLSEAITRRYANRPSDEPFPDLLLIDGGKIHLEAAVRSLQQIEGGLHVDIIAIAKEKGRHDKGSSQETLYIYGQQQPIMLPITSKALLFFQNIRDEAHRFVLSFQRKIRTKQMIESQLLQIPGIGPQKAKRLLLSFDGLSDLSHATVDEIVQKTHLCRSDAEKVFFALQSLLQK